MATIAELNHVVTLRQPLVTVNDEGGKETFYIDRDQAFAKVRPVSQFRTFDDRVVMITTKEVTVRYSPARRAIDKNWRIVHEGQEHVIHDMRNEDNKFLVFTVKQAG